MSPQTKHYSGVSLSCLLLVSGVAASDKTARVLKYRMVRPDEHATMLATEKINEVASMAASAPPTLGGD